MISAQCHNEDAEKRNSCDFCMKNNLISHQNSCSAISWFIDAAQLRHTVVKPFITKRLGSKLRLGLLFTFRGRFTNRWQSRHRRWKTDPKRNLTRACCQDFQQRCPCLCEQEEAFIVVAAADSHCAGLDIQSVCYVITQPSSAMFCFCVSLFLYRRFSDPSFHLNFLNFFP